MGYLGNTPGENFITFSKQVFTIVNSQTAYTLNFSVVDENEIRLVINNVVQEPGTGKAYTASGTTLTLASALTNGTDEMYCVFLGKARETVTVPTITKDKLNLISNATAGLTVKGDGGSNDGYIALNCSQNSHAVKIKAPPHSAGQSYTLTLPQSITNNTFLKTDGSGNLSFASVGDNTPAWKMGVSSSQSLAYNTTTKINFDTSIIDTDSGVDTTNKRYTIPSGEAGKYIVHCFYRTGTGTDSASFDIFVYKNGSLLSDAEDMASFTVSQSYNTVQCTGMLDLAAGDYVEMYARQADQNFTFNILYSNEARFWGYKLIGV